MFMEDSLSISVKGTLSEDTMSQFLKQIGKLLITLCVSCSRQSKLCPQAPTTCSGFINFFLSVLSAAQISVKYLAEKTL